MMFVLRTVHSYVRQVVTNRYLLLAVFCVAFLTAIHQQTRMKQYVVYYPNDTVVLHNQLIINNSAVFHLTMPPPAPTQAAKVTEHAVVETVLSDEQILQGKFDDVISRVDPSIHTLVQPRTNLTANQIEERIDLVLLINQSLTVHNNSEGMPPGPRGTAWYQKLADKYIHGSSGKLLNHQPYKATLIPDRICDDDDIYILVYVHSAPEHYARRLAIRQTWGAPNTFMPKFKIRVLFAVGKREPKAGATTDSLQDALQFESDEYGDILQENYTDSYHNLTLKGLSVLRFISLNCQHVPFILKTDDDTFANMYGVVDHIISYATAKNKAAGKPPEPPGALPTTENQISCMLWKGMQVLRDVKSKWYVSEQDWQENKYPLYCSGLAYLFSGDVAVKMFRASFYAPFFWVDDLYISGILPMFADITHTSIIKSYDLKFQRFESGYKENFAEGSKKYFSHVSSVDSIKRLWNLIVSKHN